LILLAIIKIFSAFYLFDSYQYLFTLKELFPQWKSVEISNWDIIWLVRGSWIMGIAAIISGTIIFWNNIYSWSIVFATCIVLFVGAVASIYNIHFVNDYNTQSIDQEVAPYLFLIWLIPLVISVLGIITITQKSRMKSLPEGFKKWYLTLGISVLLILLIYV